MGTIKDTYHREIRMSGCVELGRYDKIEEVYIAYSQFGIQGIGFRTTNAIGRKNMKEFGFHRYNFVMKLKHNEYITKLSAKMKNDGTDDVIEFLKIHTNLLPNGHSGIGEKDTSNSQQVVHHIQARTSDDILVQINVASKEGEPFKLTTIGVDVNMLDFNVRKYEMWDKKPGSYSRNHDYWCLNKLDRYDHIEEIIINSDPNLVHGVGFVIADAAGSKTSSQWFGTNDGHISRIFLKPNEYIVRISGTYEDGSDDIENYDIENYDIENCKITSIRIHTNIWLSGYKAGDHKYDRSEKKFSIAVQRGGFIEYIFGTFYNDHMFLSSIGLGVQEEEYQEKRLSLPTHETIENKSDTMENKSNTEGEGEVPEDQKN